ncbi:MAG: hypothetical protein JXR05_04240 [Flavobacteriaceae bacterium]
MKRIFYFLSILFLISCGNSTNSADFIASSEGRYLFNSDEAIEIYFEESVMKVKWRGKDMTPIKASEGSFYLKEMNEKLVFVSEPEMHIELAPKREHEGEIFHFSKLKKGEKTPSEYFKNKEYQKAMDGYLVIQKKDSLSRTIRWRSINNLAHRYFSRDKKEEAMELFKINIALYPNKPAAYRNYGYALLEVKDTINAIKNYRKALSIDPDDYRALSFFERIKKK